MMMMMIGMFFQIILLLCILIMLLHESTDLNIFKQITNTVDKQLANIKSTIYIDVFTDTNNITSGRDTRLAIVHPFNWYFLNSRSNIYVYSTFYNNDDDFCKNNNTFLKLNHPLSTYRPFENLYRVCLPLTISSMILYFSNKPTIRLYFPTTTTTTTTKKKKITVIDIVNFLLSHGIFTNRIN